MDTIADDKLTPADNVTALPTVASATTDPKVIKRRFSALNTERLNRAREALKPDQRLFFDVLPLLFHINHPSLPGFVSKKTPTGIADFRPSRRTLEAAGRMARKFSYRRRAMRVYNIQAIYVIGSSGSIAHSEDSDFDIWICRRGDLTGSQIDSLRQKCSHVREWARSIGLEANFFVMDPEAFRRGETDALSADNSGSAQYHLLLEEFYRTGVLIAGRYPAWWLVPPENENDYDNYLNQLGERGLVVDHEYVDFGSIQSIPAEEFLGAALWQLHKAVDSPYKSVLKLLLMEAYSAEYPYTDLLCTRFKRALHNGEARVEDLDPYVLMVNKVEEYLGRRGDDSRLELARKCFYFKVDERLSERAPRNVSRRREMLTELADRWEWTQDQLLILDSRATWKIHRVLEERQALVDELTRSYRIVSDFAREHAQHSRIDAADLNLLGRRLYTAFERKAGKVEIINPGISTDLTEQRLSFAHVRDQERMGWVLHRGEYQGTKSSTPLKRAHSLIELVAWCHFNRLIGPQTLLTLHNARETVSSRELLAVIDSFRRLFPEGGLPNIDMEDLRRPARIRAGALFINLGIDPLHSHTQRGVHLTSNRSDALSYGGFWKNLALTFDLLVITSWGEVLTFRYSGETALLDCLCDYMAWTPVEEQQPPPEIPVYSFSTARGMAIAHRVEELVRDARQTFYDNETGRSARFVVRISHNYHVLQPENGVPRHRRAGDAQALARVLGEAQECFSPVVFDRYAMADAPLAYMLEYNEPDCVQVFYYCRETEADMFVLDEKGSLVSQVVPFYDHAALIGQYQRFLESVIQRCNATERAPHEVNIANQVRFYRLQKNRSGQYFVEKGAHIAAPQQNEFLGIQVIGDPVGDDEALFALYCDGREFSAVQYGDGLFTAVARYVVSRRKEGMPYPIYITDVDVSRIQLEAPGNQPLQVAHYLKYKARIEQRLNFALKQLDRATEE